MVCEQYKVPFVTPTATNTKVTMDPDRKTYAFRACFIDPFQGTAGATFASNNLHAKTAAAMYDQGNDYTVGLKDAFEQSLHRARRQGRWIPMAYTKNDTDFSASLTKIAALKPDILYLPDYYQQVSLIGGQARKLGIKSTFMGGDGWDSSQIDWSAMDGGYFSNHYSADNPDPIVQKWVKDYKEATAPSRMPWRPWPMTRRTYRLQGDHQRPVHRSDQDQGRHPEHQGLPEGHRQDHLRPGRQPDQGGRDPQDRRQEQEIDVRYQRPTILNKNRKGCAAPMVGEAPFLF